MRSNYREIAAGGLITFEELVKKLEQLEDTRVAAERELGALEGRWERVEQLERDRDVLLESYAGMAPTALPSLSSEERRGAYKMLKLCVEAFPDRTCLVSGAIGGVSTCKPEVSPT